MKIRQGLTAVAVSLMTLWLAGCAMQKYHPAPIAPQETAARLETRSLDDPELEAFIRTSLGEPPTTWPLKSWDLKTLTLAALYFNPDMEVARSRVAASAAGEITAGERPNPSVRIAPGLTNSPESPWLFGLPVDFTVETAGRRAKRVVLAKQITETARLDLASTAWTVRSRLRAALMDHLLAARRVQLLQDQERLQAQSLALLEERLAAGEIPRPEVDAASIALAHLRVSIRSAEMNVSETRAAIAAAVGVPVSALQNAHFSWPDFFDPPNTQSLSPEKIQREAVLNRLDVQRALSGYAVTEAALRLEIAKQYPDLHIGPGYDFDEGHNKYSIGFGFTLPIFNRNQGPIAAAEARRQEAAARFLATQAQGIAASELALAHYRGALSEWKEANESLLKIQKQREQMIRRAVALGESDRLALTGVELQGAASALTRLDALQQVQMALGELEDSVQRPLRSGDLPPLSPQSTVLNPKPQGGKP